MNKWGMGVCTCHTQTLCETISLSDFRTGNKNKNTSAMIAQSFKLLIISLRIPYFFLIKLPPGSDRVLFPQQNYAAPAGPPAR